MKSFNIFNFKNNELHHISFLPKNKTKKFVWTVMKKENKKKRLREREKCLQLYISISVIKKLYGGYSTTPKLLNLCIPVGICAAFNSGFFRVLVYITQRQINAI